MNSLLWRLSSVVCRLVCGICHLLFAAAFAPLGHAIRSGERSVMSSLIKAYPGMTNLQCSRCSKNRPLLEGTGTLEPLMLLETWKVWEYVQTWTYFAKSVIFVNNKFHRIHKFLILFWSPVDNALFSTHRTSVTPEIGRSVECGCWLFLVVEDV